jgi:hypothetical protein
VLGGQGKEMSASATEVNKNQRDKRGVQMCNECAGRKVQEGAPIDSYTNFNPVSGQKKSAICHSIVKHRYSIVMCFLDLLFWRPRL